MQRYAAYVLWDQETRNLLLDSPQEDEALAFVRSSVTAFGEAAILHWALYGEDGSDDEQSATLIARGYQLAAYASGEAVANLTPHSVAFGR